MASPTLSPEPDSREDILRTLKPGPKNEPTHLMSMVTLTHFVGSEIVLCLLPVAGFVGLQG